MRLHAQRVRGKRVLHTENGTGRVGRRDAPGILTEHGGEMEVADRHGLVKRDCAAINDLDGLKSLPLAGPVASLLPDEEEERIIPLLSALQVPAAGKQRDGTVRKRVCLYVQTLAVLSFDNTYHDLTMKFNWW